MNRHTCARAARWGGGAILAGLVCAASSAQTPAPSAAVAESPGMPPIECWWRTSVGAVRLGEPFSLLLTCAVVENESTTVVPDQTRLDPSVLQLAPFEVLGGLHASDLRSGQRRFFQYEYRLRVFADEVVGKDVKIPSLSIAYRVRSRVQGADVEGRDQTYILPSESIRVLALVPSDASDIRDVPTETFSAIEARRVRASELLVVGGALFGLGALLLVLAAVQLVRRYRRRVPDTARLIADRAVRRALGREFASVRRQAQGGWTAGLMARALAALRIAGGYALSYRISQTAAAPGRDGHEGQLLVRGGWLRGKRVLVSCAVTAENVSRALAREETEAGRRVRLEALHTALSRFDAACFGRDAIVDTASLDASLESGVSLLWRLKVEQLWLMKKLKAVGTSAAELGSRVWSR